MALCIVLAQYSFSLAQTHRVYEAVIKAEGRVPLLP